MFSSFPKLLVFPIWDRYSLFQLKYQSFWIIERNKFQEKAAFISQLRSAFTVIPRIHRASRIRVSAWHDRSVLFILEADFTLSRPTIFPDIIVLYVCVYFIIFVIFYKIIFFYWINKINKKNRHPSWRTVRCSCEQCNNWGPEVGSKEKKKLPDFFFKVKVIPKRVLCITSIKHIMGESQT